MDCDAYAEWVKSFKKTRCGVGNCETKQIKGCGLPESASTIRWFCQWRQLWIWPRKWGAVCEFARRRRRWCRGGRREFWQRRVASWFDASPFPASTNASEIL